MNIFSFDNIALYVLCYLAGSIPVAYLFVRIFHKKDIRKEGSGNVGTLNAFKVSESKLEGLAVLLADFLKGALPVLYIISRNVYPAEAVYLMCIFIILGHNYPVWLGFKGGRGLATGAGIFSVLNVMMIAAWGIVWCAVFLFKKKVLISNFLATLSIPLHSILFRGIFLKFFPPVLGEGNYVFFIAFSTALTLLILSRHREVIAEILPVLSKNLNKQ